MSKKGRQKLIQFRNGINDVNSPDKSFGFQLKDLSLNQVFRIDISRIDILYDRVNQEIGLLQVDESLGDSASSSFITFKKRSSRYSESRNYLHIKYATRHGNTISALARLIPRGEVLYIGLSGYVLPAGISWIKVFVRLFLTIIVYSLLKSWFNFLVSLNPEIFVNNVVQFFLELIHVDLISLSRTLLAMETVERGKNIQDWYQLNLIALVVSMFMFWKTLVIRLWVWRGRIGLALRLEFYRESLNDQFDYDDIVIFSKSIMFRMSQAIREAFRSEGVEVESLEEYEEKINTVNINTGGGLLQIIGSAIGINNNV